MWITGKDYENFVKDCRVIYFEVDLAKLMEQIYEDGQSIYGVTFEDLHGRCQRFCQRLLEDCPENMKFEQYVFQTIPEESKEARKILIELYDINN